jgi:two-component system cell cycle response regulator
MKILIADDDLTSRSIMTAVLTKCGFDPVIAEDGRAAWDLLQRPDAPRLILLDWSMPGMDGVEICRRLRDDSVPDPPYIVLVTARGKKSDIVAGLEAGANDYVAKPYDNEELLARIRVGQRMLEMQSKLMETRDAMEHQANHDFLTGVYNRRAIRGRLGEEISRAGRDHGSLSVGMFDIDHFKNINDTFGHQAGDEALVAFTRRIQGGLREYDSVGRYGGEEFLVIAPGSVGSNSESLYERLRARVAGAEIATNAGSISLTVSIGVAPGTGRSAVDALIAAADAALYQAKAGGRNRVAYAPPDDEGGAEVRKTDEREDDDGRKSEKKIETGKKGRAPVA